MARSAGSPELPPPLELICLKALWTLGEANVSGVQRSIKESKPLAYTTVMTLLDRLARKGVASRRKVGRAFVYSARVSQDSIRRLAFQQFLKHHFDGSADQLLEFLQAAPEARAGGHTAVASASLDTVLL